MNLEGWSFPTVRKAELSGQLLITLQQIEHIDKGLSSVAYERREQCVWRALYLARVLGFAAGVRIDPKEPDWPVVFIELPGAGQVSWHMPQHVNEWDGHTTEEKYDRIRRLLAALQEVGKA